MLVVAASNLSQKAKCQVNSTPYTKEELEAIRTHFRNMASYKDNTISSKELPELLEKMDYHRTPEQVAVYIKNWEDRYNEVIPLSEFMAICESFHDTSGIARNRAAVFDKNGDGFISDDEFEEVMQLLLSHDPRLKRTSFEDFVASADTNKDGKVSVDELAVWLEQFLSKV